MFTKALGIVFLSVLSIPSSAQVLDTVDKGWYTSVGSHSPNNMNYIVGQTSGRLAALYRNWFVFDLSGVTDTITGATLVLFQPPPNGYISPDPTETFQLWDVSTDPLTLIAGTGGVDAYTDLGSGVTYGSSVVVQTDEMVTVDLNASAVAGLNAADGLFSLGGSLPSLSGALVSEYAFGNSGSTFNLGVRLVLQTVPAECFLLIGDAPASSNFYPGLYNWTTQVGGVEDFYLVALDDIPEFELPGRYARRLPTPQPSNPAGEGVAAVEQTRVPLWMQDNEFFVQVVMWNPDVFPNQPVQFTHGLRVKMSRNGRLITTPYGSGTGMTVGVEEFTKPNGKKAVRFPFTIPGF